jgi:histidyl-tRNA synthetase
MIQLIRGFKDILPGEVELWQEIESVARRLFEDFGFKEIRIPIMEKTELFARSIGEDTDIVEKEMYTFPDRKGQRHPFVGHTFNTNCMPRIRFKNFM